MKHILTEWRKFLNERVKPSEFYPSEFNKFLELIREHEKHLWVFFDTETTGLMYKNKEVQVTQIACVVYNVEGITEGQKPRKVNEFDVKLELEKDVLDAISAQDKEVEAGTFTGYKPIRDLLKMNQYEQGERPIPMLAGVKKFDSFLKQVRGKSPSGEIVIIAQNSPFDVGVINTAYERLGLEVPDDELWDTKGPLELYLIPIVKMIKDDPQALEQDKKLVKNLTKVSSRSGEYISTSLGVVTAAFNLEDKGWHNALADVQMTMDLLTTIIDYVKEKQDTYKVDTSKVKPFDPTAGDPYSPKRSS